MNARRIEYHEGASANVSNAVTWYRQRSPKAALDFIEELRRAADVIREAPERWPMGKNKTRRFLLWRFPFAITIRRRNPWSQSGLSLTEASAPVIGHTASN